MTLSSIPSIDDFILPFQIESLQIRGRLIRLSTVADTIIHKHEYPPPIAQIVGESLAITACLANMLKFDGIFTLQTKTDGAVRFLVADMTSEGHLRGYCHYNSEEMEKVIAANNKDLSLPRLMGTGYLAFTVDQGDKADPYQGIVELTGNKLVDCVHHYFQQSEQLEAAIKVATGELPSLAGRNHWRAGAIMLQRIPLEGGSSITLDAEEQEDGWRRLMYLLGTCTDEELTDPYLTAQQLLFRLFHEDGVRVFKPTPLVHKCRCNRERVENVLLRLTAEDLQEMQIDGKIVVTCQFCNSKEIFTWEEINRKTENPA
ncbi:MAG: molecular chaperone Hsp33 [Alphaproteobacteria bacterium]|nr:MAG: molecular chaperone Hsp33 [Alphaproteobacteria bacterium]